MSKLIPAPRWLTSRPLAHRGYHDIKSGRAENSLSAFQAAIDAGFGIECDLQISSTGEPVVFHDPLLGRMTGIDGKVRDFSPKDLSNFQLAETGDCIAKLSSHLALVADKVPVVLELKGIDGDNSALVQGVAEALMPYEGQVAVMSFNHEICSQFRNLLPNIPRGLTAEGDETYYEIHHQAMEKFDLHFVSYEVREIDCRFVHDMRALGIPIISWTVRDDHTRKLSEQHADQMTFEGFDPRVEQSG
ncbi:MAG: glycerophosphodiester phosphodiesterase family protein [Rhizobiaceae bacterium]